MSVRGFKYPELFGTVIIDAGALIDPNLSNIPMDRPMFGVFGRDNERRVAEHPLTLARQNADKLRGQTRIRIGCGSLDNLLPRNTALHELLTELRLEHEYEIVPDVAHNSQLYYQKLGVKQFEFPLPGNYPGEHYGWPANSQWRWDRDGVVHYPLTLRKLVVELNEKVLHLKTFAPPPRPEICLKILVVGQGDTVRVKQSVGD